MTKCFFAILMVFTIAVAAQDDLKTEIDFTLDQWHKAAAEADFDAYFGIMADDGVFIGTDASENWQNKPFKDFSRPYFDKGKAWSFTAVERNIYLNEGGDVAWFDELLKTRMQLCRGSGVLIKQNGKWRIKHYVLSLTIPNDDVNSIAAAKKERDSIFISKLTPRNSQLKQN